MTATITAETQNLSTTNETLICYYLVFRSQNMAYNQQSLSVIQSYTEPRWVCAENVDERNDFFHCHSNLGLFLYLGEGKIFFLTSAHSNSERTEIARKYCESFLDPEKWQILAVYIELSFRLENVSEACGCGDWTWRSRSFTFITKWFMKRKECSKWGR